MCCSCSYTNMAVYERAVVVVAIPCYTSMQFCSVVVRIHGFYRVLVFFLGADGLEC